MLLIYLIGPFNAGPFNAGPFNAAPQKLTSIRAGVKRGNKVICFVLFFSYNAWFLRKKVIRIMLVLRNFITNSVSLLYTLFFHKEPFL